MQKGNAVDRLFRAASVAIIGASEEPGKIGSGLYKSIAAGFPGKIYCVNPKYEVLWHHTCYSSVRFLPETPDLAVIAVASRHVYKCLQECAAIGVASVVVISAGFKETGAQGLAMEREIADFCRRQDMLLLGPNTLGLIDTSIPLNCTFLPAEFAAGPVSVISQSGGVGMAVLAALQDQHCGLAKWVGIGNEAVLDAVQLLEFLAEDPATQVIAVCFEGLRDLPGFLRLAAQVNRKKPIVLLRDGKGTAGRRAAASHTGAMVQSGGMMRDLIRQAGLLEARSCRECAAMLKALSIAPPAPGNRAAILTNTAGPSILAADALEAMGTAIPLPSRALQAAIDRGAGAALELKNPADISSHGLTPRTYGIAAEELLSSAEYDILLGFFSLNPHLLLPEQELMHAVQAAGKPAVACFLSSEEAFRAYGRGPEQAGIPCYCDPQDAASAVAALVHHGAAVSAPEEPVRRVMTEAEYAAVSRFLDAAGAAGRQLLPEREAKELLRLAGAEIDVPVLTETAEEALAAAAAMGYPVVLKLHSDAVSHKSDAGGVRLNLRDAQELAAAYEEMLPAMRRLDPAAMLTVQPMRPEGFELILGGIRMAGIGPVVMAGTGGVYAEVFQDAVFRAAPMGCGEPMRMLDSLRCAPVLDGFRGQPLDKAGTARLLQRLADVMEAFPQIREIDVNPCRVYPDRAVILDARVILDPAAAPV